MSFDKCTHLCNPNPCQNIEHLHHPRRLFHAASYLGCPYPFKRQSLLWFFFSLSEISLIYSRMSYEWVKVVCSLWVWILSPSIMHLRFHAQGCVCISGLFLFIAERKVLVTQSCPTLWDPTDCSPPGSSVHVILKARILECVAILFPRGYSQCRAQTQVSYIASKFLTIWATREALLLLSSVLLCG